MSCALGSHDPVERLEGFDHGVDIDMVNLYKESLIGYTIRNSPLKKGQHVQKRHCGQIYIVENMLRLARCWQTLVSKSGGVRITGLVERICRYDIAITSACSRHVFTWSRRLQEARIVEAQRERRSIALYNRKEATLDRRSRGKTPDQPHLFAVV